MVENCIEWKGAKNWFGYGMTYKGGKPTRVHRKVCAEKYGKTLDEISGLVVRHLCNNPSCVNPDHLALGTAADNVKDRVLSGRSDRGESRHSSKLTEGDVKYIRKTFSGERGEMTALSKKFGVSVTTISYVLSGKKWGWLNG